MAIGTSGISQGRTVYKTVALTAGVTPEVDLLGATLVGVYIGADITSTSFTIQGSIAAGGTFVTLKDPLASGADITYTVAATATGLYKIRPEDTYAFRYIKLTFSASETPNVTLVYRGIE